MTTHRLWSILLLLMVYSSSTQWFHVRGYPLMVKLSTKDNKCFRFNIPKDDDAHVAFLPLPSSNDVHESDRIEEWYFDAMYDLNKRRYEHDQSFPRRFVDQPDEELLQWVDTFMSSSKAKPGGRSGARIKFNFGDKPRHRIKQAGFFVPVVMNHVKKMLGVKQESDNLEGYEICLDNAGNDLEIQIIFDIIYTSENYVGGDSVHDSLLKKESLSPLETKLEESIAAAHSVLKEIRYMENREARMRITTENINSRLRYFSYLSVAVLLGITYAQVTYLKKYFKKKKLM